jgi:4'-phosphopantetheinyl transferase
VSATANESEAVGQAVPAGAGQSTPIGQTPPADSGQLKTAGIAYPADGRVDVWCVFLDDVTETELSAYRALASSDEIARCDRFLVAEPQRRFLVSRALVRTTLSQYVEVPPLAWTFSASPNGKPSILEPPGTGLRFNVSHTAGLAVCAITSEADVGVDAEYVDRDFAAVSVARLSFTPEEAAFLDAAPAEERLRRFFQLWTLKEAFLKGIGLGLSVPMRDFGVRLEPQQPPRLSNDAGGCNWKFAQVRLGRRHQVAICVDTAEPGELSVCIRQVVPLRGIVRCETLPSRMSNEWTLEWH